MRVLIYKRTHAGDPDAKGIFGIHDCMGRCRDWNFDAVIGIGGSSPWRKDAGIKHKINWVGIGPRRIHTLNYRGDRVVFSHFELYEEKGMDIENNFPNLFDYMYRSRKRFVMSLDFPKDVLEEVGKILNSVKDSPASKAYNIGMDSVLEVRGPNSVGCGKCQVRKYEHRKCGNSCGS